MRRLLRWLTSGGYAKGGLVLPATPRDGDVFVISPGYVSFDGGETWQYTDEDPTLDALNKRDGR